MKVTAVTQDRITCVGRFTYPLVAVSAQKGDRRTIRKSMLGHILLALANFEDRPGASFRGVRLRIEKPMYIDGETHRSDILCRPAVGGDAYLQIRHQEDRWGKREIEITRWFCRTGGQPLKLGDTDRRLEARYVLSGAIDSWLVGPSLPPPLVFPEEWRNRDRAPFYPPPLEIYDLSTEFGQPSDRHAVIEQLLHERQISIRVGGQYLDFLPLTMGFLEQFMDSSTVETVLRKNAGASGDALVVNIELEKIEAILHQCINPELEAGHRVRLRVPPARLLDYLLTDGSVRGEVERFGSVLLWTASKESFGDVDLAGVRNLDLFRVDFDDNRSPFRTLQANLPASHPHYHAYEKSQRLAVVLEVVHLPPV